MGQGCRYGVPGILNVVPKGFSDFTRQMIPSYVYQTALLTTQAV
jgi:hypothetical protein